MPFRATRSLQINYAGQQYSGLYTARNGLVTVSSAYGSKSEQALGKPPGAIAARLLKEIVEDYRR